MDYDQLFSHWPTPPASHDLLDKTLKHIYRHQRLKTIKYRLVIFCLGILGSVAAFIPALKATQTGLTQSGFMQFASLIFSDWSIVTTYWQNFLLSLLESLPVISLAALLATVLIFLESFKFLVRDLKTISNPLPLTHR